MGGGCKAPRPSRRSTATRSIACTAPRISTAGVCECRGSSARESVRIGYNGGMTDTLWLAAVGIRDVKHPRWGYIDRSGRRAIEPRYQSAEPFSEGLACVETETDVYGFIDRNGELCIPAELKQV